MTQAYTIVRVNHITRAGLVRSGGSIFVQRVIVGNGYSTMYVRPNEWRRGTEVGWFVGGARQRSAYVDES